MSRESRRGSSRTALNYYVPLFVTVSLGAGALAAWILRERDENNPSGSSSDDEGLVYSDDPSRIPRPTGGAPDNQSTGVNRGEDDGLVARVSGAIRRTPSPQQMFEQARGSVMKAVGGVLGSIREEEGFGESQQWREEASLQASRTDGGQERGIAGVAGAGAAGARQYTGRRKTVVVILDADVPGQELHHQESSTYHTEDASILSHIAPSGPQTKLFVLLYSPKSPHSRESSGSHAAAPPSMGSSYGGISTPGLTPHDELSHVDPQPHTPALSARSGYDGVADGIRREALRLVERESMIMPFETKNGWVYMLKHLAPDVVYLVDSLTGDKGEFVEQVKGWVGQVVVIVGGEGHAGLADTEDEGEDTAESKKREQWWESSDMVGLGKGVEVVEAGRLGEDWSKRVVGRE